MFKNKILISIVVVSLLLLVVAATYIKLPLPEGINKYNTITSNIMSCEIQSQGDTRYGKSFLFVGIKLSNIKTPYLSWETEQYNRKEIEGMCKNKVLVEIRYEAQKLLIRPKITYWVESLTIIKT